MLMAQKKKKTKVRSPARMAYLLAVLCLAASVILFFVQQGSNKDLPFNKNAVSGANFPFYYPSSLPRDYNLDQKSAAVNNGILFFTLKNVGRTINITEQAEPKQPPDLANLQKFNTSLKNLSINVGTAVLGIDPGTRAPVAIIITNTTLINVSASANTPQDVVKAVVQNMRSLPQ